PEHWKRFMEKWVGDPEKDRDLLVERSPITYVDQVTAALLVIQGAHDPRVVRAESDQMVERLKAKGLPVEYIVYEDEGHGFTKRKNELSAWRATVDFLERHLLSVPS
ncbi:MAG: alpha/beta hydrolase family protein, partial [Thermoplasmata archaeon]